MDVLLTFSRAGEAAARREALRDVELGAEELPRPCAPHACEHSAASWRDGQRPAEERESCVAARGVFPVSGITQHILPLIRLLSRRTASL